MYICYNFRHGRGRGRGHRGSRGGRSFSDDGRDNVQEGGRAYSARGYYSDNRGGYHGGRGGRGGMGRGGYGPQDRNSSSSHASESTSADRQSTENSHAGIRGPTAGGIHGSNDRREMHAGGSSGNIAQGETTNYPGHGAHQGDARSQGNMSASGGSGTHGHSTKFAPAPEFEMKGNDFPALPGAGESLPRKTSESSEGANAWGESNRYVK